MSAICVVVYPKSNETDPWSVAYEVIGESEDGKYWIVQWDGLNHPRPLEKVLISPEVTA